MKDEFKKEIGERMKEIRKILGYTQEKMVSFFDIGRANYSRIENGEVLPSAQILHTLRMKFGVSLDWLITKSGNMFIHDLEQNIDTEKADFGEYTHEITDLFNYIKRVPMVKHAMLSYFLEYKIRHQKILQKFAKELEIPGDGDMKLDTNEGQ